MKFTVWYSTESLADYIIDHTDLRKHECLKRRIQESDASKPTAFHAVPDHIKKILYLDAPDIIVELDANPIFTIEESKEAGTGHNVFQRFSRLAASAENGIPAFYIYPEAVLVERQNGTVKWDVINPLICYALERLMAAFCTPALLFFYPTNYPSTDIQRESRRNKGILLHDDVRYLSCPRVNEEMTELFECINLVLKRVGRKGLSAVSELMGFEQIKRRREWHMQYLYANAKGRSPNDMSPLSSTSIVPTTAILKYLSATAGAQDIQGLLTSREQTVVYHVDALFKGDPYPGALAAIDYMLCRNGRTFEDRDKNLVMVWGKFFYETERGEILVDGEASIHQFCKKVRQIERHNLLNKSYDTVRQLKSIPRYYMQTRYGSMFSKAKDIRVYSYFCDAILFKDGVLWREG